jgi:hypothetical protein
VVRAAVPGADDRRPDQEIRYAEVHDAWSDDSGHLAKKRDQRAGQGPAIATAEKFGAVPEGKSDDEKEKVSGGCPCGAVAHRTALEARNREENRSRSR